MAVQAHARFARIVAWVRCGPLTRQKGGAGSGKRGMEEKSPAVRRAFLFHCELKREGFEIFAEGWAEIFSLEGEIDGGLEHA